MAAPEMMARLFDSLVALVHRYPMHVVVVVFVLVFIYLGVICYYDD